MLTQLVSSFSPFSPQYRGAEMWWIPLAGLGSAGSVVHPEPSVREGIVSVGCLDH